MGVRRGSSDSGTRVAGNLHHPRVVRMRRNSGNVFGSRCNIDKEQARCRLRAQEVRRLESGLSDTTTSAQGHRRPPPVQGAAARGGGSLLILCAIGLRRACCADCRLEKCQPLSGVTPTAIAGGFAACVTFATTSALPSALIAPLYTLPSAVVRASACHRSSPCTFRCPYCLL